MQICEAISSQLGWSSKQWTWASPFLSVLHQWPRWVSLPHTLPQPPEWIWSAFLLKYAHRGCAVTSSEFKADGLLAHPLLFETPSLSPVAWGRLIRCLLLDRMGESHFSSDGTERRHSGSCMRSGRMAMSLRQWTGWFCTFWLLLWPVDILEIPGNGEKQIPIATCFIFIICFRRLKEGMLPRFAAIKRNGFFTSRHFYYGPFRLFRLKFSHPRQRNLKEVTYGKI